MATSSKPTIQILVANASKAYSYATNYLGNKMQLVKTYDHPESRQKAGDLTSDRAGRYHSSKNAGHGAFIESTPPKQVAAEHFAHELAHDLNQARNGNRYDRLVIIAPPHFHGLLNKYCSEQVRGRIIHDLKKDYTKLPEQQLQAHLERLYPGDH